jgi:hypothetical protein
MSLLNDTHRLFIKEMAVHLDLDGENLAREVALYIDGVLQEEQTPHTAERILGIVTAKLKELEDDAEAERKKKNAKNLYDVFQPVAGTSKELEPQQQGGEAVDDVRAPPVEPRGSSRLRGGLGAATEAYRRRLGIAVGVANTMSLEDLEACLEASEKLTEAYVDLQAHLTGKAEAEGEGDAWQQDFAAWTADVGPVKGKLTAAIKVLQSRQRKHMYQAASRAVDRALSAANEAMGDDDPDEIEEVRQQLSARMREMEAAAAYLEEDPLLEDNGKLQEAEKSLRKLGKKKTVLLQKNDIGSSPALRMAPWRRQEPAGPVAPPATV